MALRFCDSFDHYVTADALTKWTSSTSYTGVTAAEGRRSTSAARFNGNTRDLIKTLDAQGTWIVGFAFRFTEAAADATGGILVALLDAGTNQCDLRVKSDGTLKITRAGTTLGTSTFALTMSIFQYIEFKVVISDTIGTAEVLVDGSSKLALTGQDTKNTANATANQIAIGPGGITGGFPGNQYYDDLYICDGTGSAPHNTFLGDIRVDALFPTSDGANSGLTPSTGSSHFALVDEAAPNADTDYNESVTVGVKDTYGMGDISHTPLTIFGTQALLNVKKDDAGAKSVGEVCRSGGTDFNGTSTSLGTSYSYTVREIRVTDPNTAAAWTKANLNAAEFGMKITA